MGNTVIGTVKRNPQPKEDYSTPALREDKSGNVFYFITQDQCILLSGTAHAHYKKGKIIDSLRIVDTKTFKGEITLSNEDDDD